MLVQISRAEQKISIMATTTLAQLNASRRNQSSRELRGAARGDKRAHLLGWRSIAEQRMEGGAVPGDENSSDSHCG